MTISSALHHAARSIRADHEMLHHYDDKYTTDAHRGGSLLHDLAYRAGFQMMVGFRTMRFFCEAGVPVAAKILARGIRFLYGADLHWDAKIDDGVVIVHGMGIAISPLVHVGSGCILSHNVSLGEGRDPSTGATGAPNLEEGVHVGPGSILLGPITVGAGSKIAAGSVLKHTVPRSSVLEPPEPLVHLRAPRPATSIEHLHEDAAAHATTAKH